MTTPRRRVLRRPVTALLPDPRIERRLQQNRARLERERTAFDRWLARLRRAANEVTRRQKVIVRLERQLSSQAIR